LTQTSRWKVLFIICIFMLAFALTFQSIPPLLGFIISSLGISHAQAGALMSFFALPGIVISIPGGILADVYGSKRVGLAALVVVTAGALLVGLGNSFALLATGRIITGIGALTVSIVAPQILSHWFTEKDLGKALGIFHMVMPLGTVFALNMFGRIAVLSNWRLPIFLSAIYCLFVLILFFYKYTDSPQETELQRGKSEFKQSILAVKKTGWPAWLVAAIWMAYNGAAITYFTFASDYYMSTGYSVSYAGFLASLFMIASFLFSPLVGYLMDRGIKEEYFIIGGSTILALLLLLIPRTDGNPLVLGGLIGIFAVCVPAPVFSLVPKSLPAGQVGLGYGILSTFLNFGVIVGPLLVGLSYDRTQSYLVGFDLMAFFALSTAIITILYWFITRPKPGEQKQKVGS